jgi:uncharacterized repeat protein (TIGR04138 family)
MAKENRAALMARVAEIAEKDGRYSVECFLFVFEALSYAQAKFGKKRHVTGKELLAAVKDLALDRYGPMSVTVFEHWGAKTTDDFGEIVFLLVAQGLLGKTSSDSKEDFHEVYSFDDVFVRDYKYGSKV